MRSHKIRGSGDENGRNGTSNGPRAHAQSEKKKMEVMTVLLEALLECCTFTILCKILPRRLLITNTKDSRHEF